MATNPTYNVWDYFENFAYEGVSVCKLCKQRMKNDRSWSLKSHLKKLHSAKKEVWNYFDNIAAEGVAVCKTCKQCVRNNRSTNLTQHLEKEHEVVLFNFESWPRRKAKPNKTRSKNVSITISDDECTQTSSQALALTKSPNNVLNRIDEDIKNATPAHTNDDFENEILGYCVPTEITKEVTNANDRNTYSWQSVVDISTLSHNDLVLQKVLPEQVMNVDSPTSTSQIIHKRKTNSMNESLAKKAKQHLSIQMEEKTLLAAVWGLIVDDGVTPALFGSKHMQAILQPICDAIAKSENKEFKIDEAESERIICVVANKLRNDFSNDLDWRLLSLKIDADVNGPVNTFCVSANFVHDGSIHTHILGLIDLLDDPQLTERHIKQILHKFNIDSNQIINISWDNSKSKYNSCIQNSEYLREIEHFAVYPHIQFGNITLKPYIGVIAQLCLLDIFKNSNILQPFLECRNLAKFISNPTNGFYELFEQNNLSIPELDSPWKWGSTYNMIHALHEARNILKDFTYPKLENQQDQFYVKNGLWLFIEAFSESISFLQKTITKYYSEEMHFGDFYAQWLKAKILSTKFSKSYLIENHYIKTITTELLACMDLKTKCLLNEACYQACLYLDPRFHHTLGEDETTKATTYLKEIWSRFKIYNADLINEVESQEQGESKRFDDDEDAFLNEFLCQDLQKVDKKTSNVYNKIDELKLPFKPADTTVVSFWHKKRFIDPEIYALSAICFAIPTTQIYNQNCYAHLYHKENYSKLSAFTRDNLLSVRLNSHIVSGMLLQLRVFRENKSLVDENSYKTHQVDSASITIKNQ